jgi:hypothetical protein
VKKRDKQPAEQIHRHYSFQRFEFESQEESRKIIERKQQRKATKRRKRPDSDPDSGDNVTATIINNCSYNPLS